MNDALARLPGHWHDWTFDKIWLSQHLEISEDGLHVHAGMAVLVLAALMWRRAPWHWRPWLTVVAIETLNEAYDMLQVTALTPEASLRASAHDFWMTLAWPTIILLLFPRFVRRYRPAA